ncbi:MAG: acetyl-CoA C-acyltransferase, partial [Candidatus Eremiobacteraeota bacterium]|nr:acetyl-CoA C-acyltransferase [Candidatus Eremiobacteraeota bacterium]
MPHGREVWVVEALRTPIGRYNGALASVRPDDLAALVLRAVVDRTGVPHDRIDDVYFGAANGSGEDNRNVARMAVLLAGLPVEVPGVTLNRLCGSSLQAINSAAAAIAFGEADVIVAGGVESMTRAPYVLPKGDAPFARNQALFDTVLGWRMVNPNMPEEWTISLGRTAENVAEGYGIARTAQDAFAFESQMRAKHAMESGIFARELVPVPVSTRSGTVEFSIDEHPRPQTTLDALAKLKPSFQAGGTVTAGNSSGINDGAAALLLCEAKAAEAMELRPLARIVASASAGVAPDVMGLGPIPAARKALAQLGLHAR